MDTANLERGQEIMQEIRAVDSDLREIKTNPATGLHLMYNGRHLPEKAGKEIYDIAVRALGNKRRTLMRRFNKL